MQDADKSSKPSTSNSSGKGLKLDLLARQNEMNDLISLYYAISKKRRHSKMSSDNSDASSHSECASASGSCSESEYSAASPIDEERLRKTPLKKRPIQHSGVLQDVRRITLGCAKSYVPEDDAIPESSSKPKKFLKKSSEAGPSSERNGSSGFKEGPRAKLAASKPKAAKRSKASMSEKNGSKQEMEDYALARKLQAQEYNLRERASKRKAPVNPHE